MLQQKDIDTKATAVFNNSIKKKSIKNWRGNVFAKRKI